VSNFVAGLPQNGVDSNFVYSVVGGASNSLFSTLITIIGTTSNSLISTLNTTLNTSSNSLVSLINTTSNALVTAIGASIENGYVMSPTVVHGATNVYWMDFGMTANGLPLLYATLSGTTSFVQLAGPTNCSMWKLLSLNVIASGADRTILVPDSFPHFTTNGWTHAAPYYSIVLTNGNELRLTIQSNITLSTTWQTYGQ
jgi:hypothetical protein